MFKMIQNIMAIAMSYQDWTAKRHEKKAAKAASKANAAGTEYIKAKKLADMINKF